MAAASRLRRTGEKTVRLNVYLSADTERELRIKCAIERRGISDGVDAAVRAWCKPKKGK